MFALTFARLPSLKSVIPIEKKFSSKNDKFFLVKKASEALLKSITRLDKKKLKKIRVFVGPGTNGADGIFLSSLLIKANYKVDIYIPQKSKKSHQVIIDELNLGDYIVSENDIGCAKYTLVIDGLFGTGLNKNITGVFSKIIDEINVSNAYVVSIDIPSGLNSETGVVLKKAVFSNLTCSLISLKKGLFTKSGRDFWKKIENHPLVKSDLKEKSFLFSLTPLTKYKIELFDYKIKLKPKKINFIKCFDTHKNSLGKSLIIGGNYNFFGALLLSSKSALKTGSRYIEVISTKKHAELLPIQHPELITSSYGSSELSSKFKTYNNLLIGPGLGQSKWSEKIFSEFSIFLQNNNSQHNIIVDADALNLLAKNPFRYNNWILTPHPGEAARLLGVNVATVQANRFEAANQLQKKYGGIIVLKGSGTIIKTLSDDIFVCLHGNEGMATAGMGDCLSGIILSCIGLVKNKADAVLFATAIHSLSGDLVAEKKGTIGLLATDVIKECSTLLNLDKNLE